MLSNRLIQTAERNGFADGIKLRGNFNHQCSSELHSTISTSIGKKLNQESKKYSNGVSKPQGKGRMMTTSSKLLQEGPPSKRPDYIGTGYVRRLAAKNASACVNAMLESPKKSAGSITKTNKTSMASNIKEDTAGILEEKRMTRKRKNGDSLPVELQQKRKKNTKEDEFASSSEKKMQKSEAFPEVDESSSSSDDDSLSSNSGSENMKSLVNSTRSSPDACPPDRFFEYSDDFPYSLVGLLHNGDCLHCDAKYYLKSDSSTITNRIIPCVIPSNKDNLASLKCQYLDSDKKKHKALKGDNGWSPVGSPIKTMKIIVEKGKSIERKYFIGIKRKGETLFARDSVLLRSGSKKEDIPYVAKISSIWQELGSRLMVTVFWYYRKEDTDPSYSSQFMEMEVMASQHHDDISVACIDDKCHVLGLSEFYRFKAKLERLPQLKAARLSQSVSKLKQGIVKFNIQRDFQFKELLNSEVYLCFRAYNHISGKILKV